MTDYIPDDNWVTLVKLIPILSVDLVFRTGGGIALAKRWNQPTMEKWFFFGAAFTRVKAPRRPSTGLPERDWESCHHNLTPERV